ncbi:MAG: imidazole glycerol phosphate synthase subunit HisF, partial [Flavobacteriales bacterium CG_4_10_14_0_2_um_filter_32_8]
WQVVIRAGSEPTQLDALWWARMVERLGAGEILLTSMDRDGTRLGYDIALTRTIARAVNIPVIASGGASGSASIIAVLREGRADAALAASIFHYDRALPRVKQELKNAGIRVRT